MPTSSNNTQGANQAPFLVPTIKPSIKPTTSKPSIEPSITPTSKPVVQPNLAASKPSDFLANFRAKLGDTATKGTSTTKGTSAAETKPTTAPAAPTAKVELGKFNIQLKGLAKPAPTQEASTPASKPSTQASIQPSIVSLLARPASERPTIPAPSDKALANLGLLNKYATKGTNPAAPVVPKPVAVVKPTVELSLPPIPDVQEALGQASHRVEKQDITYDLLNEKQKQVPDAMLEGTNFILNGSAGTGKTTTQRITCQMLLDSGKLQVLETLNHKTLPSGILSVAIVSYMNKATENIRQVVPSQFKNNVLTIHKFIEYAPVEEETTILNPETGETDIKVTKVFRPQRNKNNLVEGFTHIIIEEASTVSMDLWNELLDALPNRGADITFMLMGDICQLPPPFDVSVLRHSLPTWKAISLSEVYRQALDSPILRLAVDINQGVELSDEVLEAEYAEEGKLELYNFNGLNSKNRRRADASMTPQQLVHPLGNSLAKLVVEGDFVPFRDVILCPFRANKSEGINCELLNLIIANKHGQARNAEVHEVMVGFIRKYLAVGDPVLVNKRAYWITNIRKNRSYSGLPPRVSSTDLDRFGNYSGDMHAELDLEGQHLEELIAHVSVEQKDAETEERKLQCSHTITVESVEVDELSGELETLELNSVGAVMELDFAYAMSVHKSIGSEYKNVHLIIHDSMRSMCYRELVYTAVTRAKDYLKVYYSGNHAGKKSVLAVAAAKPKIRGNTFEEKVRYLVEEASLKEDGGKSLLAKFQPLATKPKLGTN